MPVFNVFNQLKADDSTDNDSKTADNAENKPKSSVFNTVSSIQSASFNDVSKATPIKSVFNTAVSTPSIEQNNAENKGFESGESNKPNKSVFNAVAASTTTAPSSAAPTPTTRVPNTKGSSTFNHVQPTGSVLGSANSTTDSTNPTATATRIVKNAENKAKNTNSGSNIEFSRLSRENSGSELNVGSSSSPAKPRSSVFNTFNANTANNVANTPVLPNMVENKPKMQPSSRVFKPFTANNSNANSSHAHNNVLAGAENTVRNAKNTGKTGGLSSLNARKSTSLPNSGLNQRNSSLKNASASNHNNRPSSDFDSKVMVQCSYWIPPTLRKANELYFKNNPHEAQKARLAAQAALTVVARKNETVEQAIQRALRISKDITVMQKQGSTVFPNEHKRHMRRVYVRKAITRINTLGGEGKKSVYTPNTASPQRIIAPNVRFATREQAIMLRKAVKDAYTHGRIRADSRFTIQAKDIKLVDFLLKFRFCTDESAFRILGYSAFDDYQAKINWLEAIGLLKREIAPLSNYFYLMPSSMATKVSDYGYLGIDNILQFLRSYHNHAFGLSSMAAQLEALSTVNRPYRAQNDVLGLGERGFAELMQEMRDGRSYIVAEREFRSSLYALRDSLLADTDKNANKHSPSAITDQRFRHAIENVFKKAKNNANLNNGALLSRQTAEYYCANPRIAQNRAKNKRVCYNAWLWIVFGNDILAKGSISGTISRKPVENAVLDKKGRPILDFEGGDLTSTRDHCPDMVLVRPRNLTTGRPRSLAIELELTAKDEFDYFRTMAGYTSNNGRILYQKVIWLVNNASVAGLIRAGATKAGCVEGRDYEVIPVASQDKNGTFGRGAQLVAGRWKNPDAPYGYAIPITTAKRRKIRQNEAKMVLGQPRYAAGRSQLEQEQIKVEKAKNPVLDDFQLPQGIV